MRMIERVAREFCCADGKNPDDMHTINTCGGGVSIPNWEFHYPFMAILALKEMTDPTEAMRIAALTSPLPSVEDNRPLYEIIWTRMIDAALAEVPNANDQ